MKLIPFITATAAVVGLVVAAPTDDGVPEYFIIRHAEKTKDGAISSRGKQREKCLIKVFGPDSKYNIQHIMTPTPHPGSDQHSHETQRPYNTTLPLANSLGITIDYGCEYEDYDCAGQQALSYNGPGNVLIAWEHGRIANVSIAIGGQDVPHYPGDHYDLIYNQPQRYHDIEITSQDCPGLDDDEDDN